MAELQTYTVDPVINDADTVLGADSANSNITRRFTIGSIITKALDDITLADLGITATADEINYLDNDDLSADDIAKLVAVTATSTELNILDGATLTTTELNFVDGVTSNIQTQLDAKQNTVTGGATTILSSNLTTGRVIVSNTDGKIAVSDITSTELGHLDGVTSSIQTQIDNIVEFEPGNTGSADQVLVRTSTGYQWQDADEASYTLPTAGPSTKGGVLVPLTSDIDIDSSGNLSLGNISANKITSGVVSPSRLSNTTPVNGYFLRYNSTTNKLEYAAANTDVTFNAADDITFTGHVKIESTDDTDTFTVTPPVDFTDGSIKFSGLTGGGTDKVLGISSTGLLSVVDKGSGGDSSITVTSTSVSDGTNTFNKYTLPDLTVADFAASAIAIESEGTLDNDTTIPTTAWVKNLGYLTSSGITVTSSSVSDGTNTFNKYTLPTSLSTLPSTIIDPSTLVSDHPYALTADASADDYKWRQFASKLDVGGVTLNVEESGISYTVHSRTSGTENATDGHVLTANGTGGVAWEAQTGTQLTDAEVIQAIVDSTSITDADKSTIRTNIGAGTSNLVIGTTATTALAGNTTIPTVTSTSVTDGTNTFNKLAIGTTATTAKAGNYAPAATEITSGILSDDVEIGDQNKTTGLKLWTGTKAQYDALTEVDDDTIYFTPDEAAGYFDESADYTLTGSIVFDKASGKNNVQFNDRAKFTNGWQIETSGSETDFRVDHATAGRAFDWNFNIDTDGDTSSTHLLIRDTSDSPSREWQNVIQISREKVEVAEQLVVSDHAQTEDYLTVDSTSATFGVPIRIGGTGTANELDDYEEGTVSDVNWVGYDTEPLVNNCHYTKIGNRVFVSGSVSWQTAPTDTDDIAFDSDSLPFTVSERISGTWEAGLAFFGIITESGANGDLEFSKITDGTYFGYDDLLTQVLHYNFTYRTTQ